MPDPNNTDRRCLILCERGPAEWRAVMYLPHPSTAKSTVELPIGTEVSCMVLLPPRYTLLLLVLAKAWNDDEGEVDTQRGYRTKEELRRRLSNPSNPEPVAETTVSQYVREARDAIRSRITKAIEALRLPEGFELRIPNLIESERGLGYRIGTCGIEILMPRTSPALTP